MMNKQKLIIHCQYVYGLGHLVRALHLAKGLSKYFDVYFLNGGEVVKNFEIDKSIHFIQIPSIFKKEDSNELICVSEDLTLAECFEIRAKMIIEIVNKVKPDVVITEHFPFGFLFEKEALNLINNAKKIKPLTKVVCSLRDIVESKKGSDNDMKTVNILNEKFDLLLVHGDSKFITIQSSFPLAHKINSKLIYTGYVIDKDLKYNNKRSNTILVSIAGGRIGNELLKAVIKSFDLIKEKIKHNLIVFNGAFNDELYSTVINDRIKYFDFNRNEFLNQLSTSDISISLGGYNSIMESLYAGNKVIIYDREFLGENKEQEIRISTLKNIGLIDVISLKDLEIENLSKVLMNQINKEDRKRDKCMINFKGVENSVYQIKRLAYDK